MKRLALVVSFILILVLSVSQKSFALINLDDESIKISIKYGLDNKYSSSKELMGPNWMEDESGAILTIFSPFIQLASKAKSQNVPGSTDEDIKLVKKRLGRQLNQITVRQEVRFIVQICGSDPDIGTKYKGKVEEYLDPEEIKASKAEEGKGFWVFKKRERKAKTFQPAKEILQNVAELDNYNPYLPYTAVNSYNYEFETINNLNKFYFVITGPNEKEIKFLIEKNVIF